MMPKVIYILSYLAASRRAKTKGHAQCAVQGRDEGTEQHQTSGGSIPMLFNASLKLIDLPAQWLAMHTPNIIRKNKKDVKHK